MLLLQIYIVFAFPDSVEEKGNDISEEDGNMCNQSTKICR